MRYLLIHLFIFNIFIIHSQNRNDEKNDSVLVSLGLSPKHFTLLTYQVAKSKYYDSKPYDFSLKPNDTIILVKVDTIYESLILNNRVIPYKLDLSNRVFKDLVDLSSCIFKREVYIVKSQFNNSVVIQNSSFDSTLFCNNTKFKKFDLDGSKFSSLEISSCLFNDDAIFNESIFTKKVHIIFSSFNNGSTFVNAKFNGYTRFSSSNFTITPFFWNTQFNDTTSFDYVVLKHGIDFQSTKFKKLLRFNSAEATGKIYFENTFLPEYIDLSNIKSEYAIDFNFINDSLKDKTYKINIYKADLSKILLTDRFSLWFDNNLSIDQRNSTYKQLLIYLDNIGHKQAYKTIDLEYRDFENEYYNSFLKRFLSFSEKIWWNYGYNKDRVFISSFVFIIFFSIIIYCKRNRFIDNIYKVHSLSNRLKENENINNKFCKIASDFLVAFLYTSFLFFHLKLSIENICFKNFGGGIFILLIFIVGLVCTAFIFNLVITI